MFDKTQCIHDATQIIATAPLPDTVVIYTDTCETCARLYMAWVNGGDKDAYVAHRKGCENGMGKR